MTITFTQLNYNTVSFDAKKDGCVVDLGIAFINVPSSLLPAAAVFGRGMANMKVKLQMDYYSGTWHPGKACSMSSLYGMFDGILVRHV